MVRIEDNLYNATFPQQKLPLSKKNEEWQHSCVNYIIGEGNIVSGGRQNTQFGELQTYYNLYNSIFDEKDFKRITNPFKVDDGFPATPQDFNIIRPKIDLLIGEETKRPMNFRVVRTSQEAVSDLMDKEKELLMQYMMAAITAKMGPEEQQQFQQQLQSGEIMPPEAIAKYMDSTYKDVVENTAYHTLVYLREKLNIDNEFIKGWKDALIAGNEVYYVGVQNDEPYMERVNPMYFSYDKSPDLEFIEDGSWCCRKMRLPVAEVYDRYYNKLDEKDLNKLNEMLTGKPLGDMKEGDPIDTGGGIQMHIYDNPEFDQKSRYCVNVWHCCWKSFKKIFYVTVLDETGTPQVQIADETYKKVGNELSVEPDWIVEVWEGYRAGSDLYFGIQPIEYQHVSIDNPNSQKLPYCGCVYSNTNSKPRSLVSILKPLQYMYIVLWYRLELAIARDKGKVINMDITQIPKSMNITPERWMHYLSSVGVNFINPYECFKFGTQVIMANGSIRKIEDIKVGDYVMGPDGNPRKVLDRHTGIDNMYRIKSGTGCDDQIVNSKHQIYYKEKNHFKDTYYTRLATPLDIIKEDANKKYIGQNRYLQRSSVNINRNADLLLDPYYLGLWLGDGFTNSPSIINEDYEVINWLSKYADDMNMTLSVTPTKSNAVELYIKNKKHNHKNPIKEALKHYNILSSKDIPEEYIYASVKDKLELLAGLIDTDGSFSKRDRIYTFSQCAKRKHIVDKVAFIARQLGFKCSTFLYKTAGKKHICDNKNISKCQDTYTLRISDGIYDIPCRIKRKQHHWENKRTARDLTHFSVEYDGIGEYCGITIDGDNLFLLKDFTVVHNCGWNIPGREGGKPATFNQITSLDLTMSNVISEYIQLMDKIEQLAGTISGITEQRQGAISSSELVGNVERSVVQSSHITEPLFWAHAQCKRHVLNMLLNTAKGAWQQSGKKKLSYIFDNGERAFLDIADKFYYEDMDVFVSDTSKDLENIQKLQQLIQPAMQNGASLLEAAEILTNDNFNIIKQKLAAMQKRQEELQQQQQQAEAQAQQQLQQMQNEAKQQELMLQEAQMDLDRYKIDQDNATKITVAEISAYRGTEEKDADNNGIPDPIEIAKDATAQMKVREDAYSKRYEAKQKREIEDAKIDLEKQRMKHETELQAQKDKAAMEREQLKARTALRNKTVGEH